MRIDRIRVGAFGRLRSYDTGSDLLERLAVVLGPNEAGKSTLFTFLTTALYGFSPATRERNPHVPWGEDEATGVIQVRLDSGSCVEVERTLRSRPTARLTCDGRTSDLRNQAVPWVGHVPRRVFRQVFAITLRELAGLDGETWARIQDKMIGSMGAADLHSARAVAECLEREAGEIWRSNRRGNQRLRDLRAELRELRGRRSAARDRDAHIRRLVEEREAVRVELRTVRERRQLDRAEVERAQSLLPVKRQLERIEALRAEGGPPEELRDLPADPPGRLADLEAERERLEGVRDGIERDMAERRAALERAAACEPLLERREEIVRLVARAAGSAQDRVKALELEAELDESEARLDAASASVLTRSWRDVPAEALGSMPTELLRERVDRAKGRVPGPAERAPDAGPPPWIPLAVGLALLAWGLTSSGTVVTALGAAVLAAAITWWRVPHHRTPNGRRPARSEAASSFVGLEELLRGIPVRPELLERPDAALPDGLERVRALSRRREELVRALAATRGRVDAVEAAARELARSLDRDEGADAETVARELDRRIREAERLRGGAAEAERELSRLAREHQECLDRLDRLTAEATFLSERGADLGEGDARRGLESARARLAARARAAQLEEELARGHPDLDALRSQIAELDAAERAWAVDGSALARAKARIEAHDERIEELLTRSEALEGEVARLREMDTVDAVDSEIETLREEEARLVRVRDRKWVLARLLRTADRRFREEHQPDLVRRAGSYLRHLTGGRYERLVVDETDGDHLFHIMGPELPAPVPLSPPVSTGTLEQAYLSLRLAIVDHLDQGGEKLPLFVDEVFVNWDGERRARGLEVLASIADARQVFVFTCHEVVAAELEGRGARVLTLTAD